MRNLYFFQGQKNTSFGKNILHRQSASLGHSATGHSVIKQSSANQVAQCFSASSHAQIAQCKCKLITIVNISTVLLDFSKLAPIPHRVVQVYDWLIPYNHRLPWNNNWPTHKFAPTDPNKPSISDLTLVLCCNVINVQFSSRSWAQIKKKLFTTFWTSVNYPDQAEN